MSTRCNIGIYENDSIDLEKPSIILYQHHDGNPEYMIPLIKKYVTKFLKGRGFYDYKYLGARLIQMLIDDAENHSEEFYKQIGATYRNKMNGFGISEDIHGDINYYYALYQDYFNVYRANGNWDGMELMETHSYDEVKTL